MVVDGIITISSKGLYVTPALPVRALGGGYFVTTGTDARRIGGGDELELRRPDGTRRPSTIRMVSHARSGSGKGSYLLGLPHAVSQPDVPDGTEIWWISEAAKSSET